MSAPQDIGTAQVVVTEADMQATSRVIAKANGHAKVKKPTPLGEPWRSMLRVVGDVAAFVDRMRSIGVKGDVAAFVQGVKALDGDAIGLGAGLDRVTLERAKKLLGKDGAGLTVRDVGAWVNATNAVRSQRHLSPDPAQAWRADLRARKGEVCESFGNLCIILEHTYADRLTFDEMAAMPCLDGKPFADVDVSNMRREIEADEDLEFSDGEMRAAVLSIATKRSFHPVRDYLRGIKWDGVKRIDRVAAEFFGATDSLSAKFIRRFFISAVARALRPGCKVDTCLVLVGDEGLKKSTFFAILGGSYFKDSKVDITDRKGMMLMHSAWVYEWPEVDRMLEKKHDSDVKAFVSQSSDSYVPMYGRAPVDRPRSCVSAGTTNREKFIASSTGSRRWWAVTVSKRIDAARLRALRDQLWAEAVALFDQYVRDQAAGVDDDANTCRWWLTPTEDLERAERNEEHQTVSPDVETAEAWLAGEPITCPVCKGTGNGMGRDLGGNPHPCAHCNGAREVTRGPLRADSDGRCYVTCADILNGPLGVASERHQQNATRAADVLRRLGWRSGARIRPSNSSSRITPYYAPEIDDEREAIRHEPRRGEG